MKGKTTRIIYIASMVLIPVIILIGIYKYTNSKIDTITGIFLGVTLVMYIIGCCLINPILDVDDEFKIILDSYKKWKNDENLSDDEKYDKFMDNLKKADLKFITPLFNEFRKTLKAVKVGVSDSGEEVFKYYSTNDIEYYFDEDNLIFKKINNRTLNQLIQGLTAVGMFGTFLGIIKGVSKLNGVDGKNMQNGIETLLSGVKTSFNSSLYGILFSVILTFALKILVDITMKKANKFCDEVNEFIDPYTEQSALSDIEEQLKNQTGTMQGIATSLVEEMSKNFNQSIQSNLESLASNMHQVINEMQRGFSSSLNKSMVETMIQITGTIQPVMEKLESTMNKLELHNQKTTDKLFEESIVSIKDAISVGTNNEVIKLQESMNAISEKNSEMIETFVSSMENMKELTKYQENLVKNTTNSTESMNVTTENLKDLQQDLSAVILNLRDVNSTSNVSLNNINDTVNLLKSSMEKQLEVNTSIEDMLVKSNKLGEAQENYISKFENLSKMMINNIENTQNTMRDLNGGMDSYKNYFDNIKVSTVEILNSLDSKYKSFTGDFEEAARKLNETADSIRNNILINMDSVGSNMKEVTNNLNNFHNKFNILIDKLEQFTDVEESTQNLWMNYKESFETLNETINESVKDYTKNVSDGVTELFTQYDNSISEAVRSLTTMVEALNESAEVISESVEGLETLKNYTN